MICVFNRLPLVPKNPLGMSAKLVCLLLLVMISPRSADAQTIIKAKLDNPKQYLQLVAGLSKTRRIDYQDYQDEPKAQVDHGDIGLANEPNLQRKKDSGVGPASPDVPRKLMTFDTSNLGGVDPMIAVGENYVIVSDASNLMFFEKETGKKIQLTNPATKTTADHIDASDFFAIFLKEKLPFLKPGLWVSNPNYVDDSYDIPDNIPLYCSRNRKLNDTKDGIISQAYDTRVAYQKDFKRYIILAALRNQCTRTNPAANTSARDRECRSYCVRLVAWAISVTENPRDGFIYYRTGENNYRDWPRFVVDKDYLTIANNGPGDDGSSMVTIYSFPDMAAGSGNVRGFSIKRQDVLPTKPSTPLPRAVIPIQNHHSSSEPYVYFAERLEEGRGLRFWYIKKTGTPSNIFNSPPSFLESAGHISLGSKRFIGAFSGIVYSRDNFWIVTGSLASGPTATKTPRYGLNLFKVPVKNDGFRKTISTRLTDGYRLYFYDHEDYSFERPAIAVNSLGDAFFSFLRHPATINSSERSQIRYKVFFHNEDEARPSHVAKESLVAGRAKLEDLDYSWAVHDPHGLSYWLAHSYGNASNGRSMYIKKVELSTLK